MKRTLTLRSNGFTLVEIAISLTILTLAMGSALFLSARGTAGCEQSMAESALLGRVGRSCEQILDLVVGANKSNMAPLDPAAPWGCDALEFEHSMGWSAGEVQWSPRVRIAFEVEDNEIDNGIDDDGDGRIDEGRIIAIENPGGVAESRRVIVRGVRRFLEDETKNGLDDNGNGLIDESGMSFERVDDVLVLRLTLEIEGSEHRMITKSFTTSIRLRN
jgi:prepilin-type N-terminal cleavage/methylation domain-containing protein